MSPAHQGQGLGRFLMAQGYGEVRLYLALGHRIDREEESALGVTAYMTRAVRV